MMLTWVHQWHASRDKSFQAFPPLFFLQAIKAGRGGLGTRLLIVCLSVHSTDYCDPCDDGVICALILPHYVLTSGG